MSDPLVFLESVRRAASARVSAIAPDLIDNEMRWVLNDFLKETRLWRRAMNVPLIPGRTDYTLTIEEYESVVGVMEAAYGPSRLGLFVQHLPYTQAGYPAWAGLLDDRTLRVYPVPDAAISGAVSLDVWLTLLVHVDQPPPTVLLPYNDALLNGLLARCYGMPDRPWTNLQLAAAHQFAYEGEKARVRRHADGGRAHGAQRMLIPRFV